LPPIDLSLKPEDQDALAILVLAPVKRSDYGNVLQTLPVSAPVLRNAAPPLLGQQKPIQALLRLNAAFLLKRSIADGTATTTEPPANFVDPAWRTALTSAKPLWYMRRRNLPDGKGLAGTPLPARTEIPDVERPETPATPPPVLRDTVPLEIRTTVVRSESETELARILEAEGLWGRFAFLRAISDAPTHAALTRMLTNSIVLKTPLLQQAVFTALEETVPEISESPEENFEQIQKDANIKVLKPENIAEVTKKLISPDIVRGLETAAKGHSKLLTDKRLRHVLGRTHRIGALAEIGLKYTKHEDFKKLMETVEKQASTGRAQSVADAIDRFLKKVNA
jgi:hypothetical protein